MSAGSGRSRRGLPAAAAGIPVPSDRRFRRSEVRPARRRNWRRTLVRSGWITGATLMSLGFLVWVVGLVIDSPVLRVNNIVPSGNARLTKAAVESQLVGIREEALLRVDLEKYRQQLAASPWVESAELWRVLPSTVHVRIVERKPLVLGRFAGQLYLIDAEGVVIDLMGPQYSDLDLPVVDGLAASVSIGDRVDPARIRLADRLLHDLSPRPDLLDRLSQVDVSSPRNAMVTLRDEPAVLYLGDEQFLSRLERWLQTAASIRQQLDIAEHMDLRYDSVMFGK